MKILVLGSDGQIGRPLTEHLKQKHEVVEFDKYSNPVNDLRVPNILDRVLRDIDFVFFLAFDVGGSLYLKRRQNTYAFISDNIEIMRNTFDSLSLWNTPFIFASSQMSGMNHSAYGTLKRIGEQYTACFNGIVLKFWNVYGINNIIKKSFVIDDFISMARTNGRIEMKTNGEELRQFLYVDDCVKCMDTVMEGFNDIPEKSLDVTSFEWTSIKQVAKMISRHFNNCPVIPGTNVDDVQRSTLNDPSEKILRYWHPETPLQDGIKIIIDNTR